MDTELFDAIYALFIASTVDSDVTQTGTLTHGLYAGIGPEEARMPYVTVNVISSVPISTFDDDSMNDTIIQFSIFTKPGSTADIGGIAKNLKTAFDRATLVYDLSLIHI